MSYPCIYLSFSLLFGIYQLNEQLGQAEFLYESSINERYQLEGDLQRLTKVWYGMDGWIDRWMNGWIDGWMDGWMDG